MTTAPLQDREPLGFIGVGRMGGPMAERLIGARYAVAVYDPDQSAVQRLLSLGATRADSPAAVANAARVVFASLPSPAVVLETVGGANGVCNGERVQVFVDLSTSGTPAAIRIDQCLREHDIQSLDAPVSGGIAGARAGTLALMASGPRSTFDAVEPLLKLLGRVFYVGDRPGMGQTLKLANNLMSQAAIAITSEALAFGVKAGLDPRLMLEVINVSSGRNTASEVKFPKHVLTRGFDFGFSAGLALKDVRMCLEEAGALGVPMSVGREVGELLARATEAYGADSDCTGIARIVESLADCEISSKRGNES